MTEIALAPLRPSRARNAHSMLITPCLARTHHPARHALTLCLAPHAAGHSTAALDVNDPGPKKRKAAEAREKGCSDGGALAN